MIFTRRRPKARADEAGALRIRNARHGDLKAIRRITAAAFDGLSAEQNAERIFGGPVGPSWQERRCRYVERDVRYWPRDAFVAEVDGRVVGYVTTAVDSFTRSGHIRNLAVEPESQGRGIGKALIAHALVHFRAHGMRYAQIEALEQNARCLALYPHLGFREIARQVMYFRALE